MIEIKTQGVYEFIEKYGADPRFDHENVLSHEAVIKQAYNKGFMDGWNKSRQWIPCSERLPEERNWYLAMFKEPDTDFMGLPMIADYLMGLHTNYTTEDGWIIANCTDTETAEAEYYKKLKCVAWMPLPEPYKESEEQHGTL